MTAEALYEALPLFPPDVVEITLRVGVVRASEHLQWQLEVRNATDGELLHMQSSPHRHLSRTPAEVLGMMALLRKHLDELAGPF